MSSGPWKIKPNVMMTALRAFKRVTKLGNDEIEMRVNLDDSSFVICARSPEDPPTQTSQEWKLPDGLEKEIRP
jgi:hypothetical protein